MGQQPSMTSPRFQFDMADWCVEKAAHVVDQLARLLDDVRGDRDERDSVVENAIGMALWNATKVLAFASGGEWSPGDRDTIMEAGYKGYENVAVKYGVLDETEAQSQARKIREFEASFRDLVVGPRSPNRKLLHVLLTRCGLSHPLIERLADLLEEVTMGRLEWDDLQASALPLLDELKATVEDEPERSGV